MPIPPRRKVILVTGSRDWTNEAVIWSAMEAEYADGCTYIVGDCPTGADAIAYEYWSTTLASTSSMDRHFANWAKHGRAAGPMRNQKMVDERPDIVLAFNKDNSTGTADCVRRAQRLHIPVKLWIDK